MSAKPRLDWKPIPDRAKGNFEAIWEGFHFYIEPRAVDQEFWGQPESGKLIRRFSWLVYSLGETPQTSDPLGSGCRSSTTAIELEAVKRAAEDWLDAVSPRSDDEARIREVIATGPLRVRCRKPEPLTEQELCEIVDRLPTASPLQVANDVCLLVAAIRRREESSRALGEYLTLIAGGADEADREGLWELLTSADQFRANTVAGALEKES